MTPEQIEALEAYQQWVEDATLEGREDTSIGAFLDEHEQKAALQTLAEVHKFADAALSNVRDYDYGATLADIRARTKPYSKAEVVF